MDCEDYHCHCPRFVEDHIPGVTAPGYCRCGCAEEDHGAGFRAEEQRSADEGRARLRDAGIVEGPTGILN